MPPLDAEEDASRFPYLPKCFGRIPARVVLGILSFFGFFVNYMLRVNMNIAIVYMTKSASEVSASNQSVVLSECLQNVTFPQTLVNTTIDDETTDEGEFSWDAHAQGLILGSYYWSYIVSLVPGGMLAERYGSKLVHGGANFVHGLMALATPLAARWNIAALIAVRLIQGFVSGMTWPSMHAMASRWIPPHERSKFASTYMGNSVGTAVTFPLCGLLIYSFGSWVWAFYVPAVLCLIWFVFWWFFVYDSPAKHPFISLKERAYLERNIAPHLGGKRRLPWLQVARSVPAWALLIADTANVWSFMTIIIYGPIYLKTVHGFGIRENGLLSGLPNVSRFIFAVIFSWFADSLLSSRKCTVTFVRKMATVVALVLPSIFFLLMGHMGCNATAEVASLTILTTIGGACAAGPIVNSVDLAPNFAGTLLGLLSMVTMSSGFMVPILVSAIIQDNESMASWRMVFLIAAVFNVFGALVYVAFGSGKSAIMVQRILQILSSDRVPARLVLGAMLLWATLTGIVLRVNLSLSIVTMVRRSSGHLNTSSAEQDENYEEEGEFDWSETTQGTILSAFFWGYLFLQLPGGRLAEVIGGRRVMGYSLLIASLLSIASPPLARVHYGLLVAVRALQGLVLGVIYPTLFALTTRWVPQQERARFLSVCMMGGSLGLALIMPLCGLVIAYLGWAALFYLTGAHGLLFTACWFLLVHDSPEQHPRISDVEQKHIASGLVAGPIKTVPIPWKSMLTSIQVWAPLLAAMGSDWGFYTFFSLGPKYMASILGVNIKQNGFLSALPYLCRYVFGIIAAAIFDRVLRGELLSLLALRRIAAVISHILPAIALVAFPLVGSDLIPALAVICIAVACNGTLTSGHLQGFMDIAPNFAGTMMGLSNGLGSITGIISPLLIGAVLERDPSVAGGVPARTVLGIMLFWSVISAFLLRVNLSLGIVAMGQGEFYWSETTQGTILSSFFWGYIVLQLPGGRLAELIGGRRVFGYALLIASLLSAATPPLARIHHSGSLGLGFVMPLCGLVITHLGWPTLFYLSAAQGILFTSIWFLLVHDGPDMHPRIALSEIHHIQQGLVAGPVKNGVLSSLPFLCRYLFGVVVAQVLDFCLRRKVLTLVQMRRCAVCISHLLPALVLFAFPLVGNDVLPAVTLLCIAMACNGALTSGHTQSSVDIAPNFSERIPARMVLGCMLFWSTLSAFLLRVNLSLSIVAMVGTRRKNGTTGTAFNASGCVRFDNTTINAEDDHEQMKAGEFDWSETTQGTILSAFFWGYLFLQLPGGRLAELIGGRRVMGCALLIASLLSIVTPPLARLHYGFLVAVRAMQGLALGVQFPTVSAIVTRWVPLMERARFYSIFIMGGTFGLSLLMPVCGIIIAYLDWPALFYISGTQGLVFTLCWFLLVHDGPELHPRISHDEQRHIERGLVAGPIKKLPVPWKSILCSMQMWAPFVAAIGSDWGFYTILTVGPKYMASILGVNMKQNGVLSALPFLCRYFFGIIVAQILDLGLRRKFLKLVQMRRCAVCISHLLPALALVAFPLAGCDMVPAVALLCMAMACNGALTSGHVQAYMDIAPNFGGTLGGFKNGLCSFTGIISPIVIGAILEQDPSVTGWRLAFAVSAAIYASSSLLFLFFFTARVQPWNEQVPDRNDLDESELRQPMNKQELKYILNFSSMQERISARIVLGMMIFWSTLSAFVLRVNLSLSIVAMVGRRRENGTGSEIINPSGCLRLIENSTLPDEEEPTVTEGEFDWSETTQGTILSAFFWGYLFLQLPGGRLAELIGGRRVMGWALLIASLFSAATPPLARVHHSLLVAVRALQGLVLGVQFPTASALVTRWVPLEERARFYSIFIMGGMIGLSVMMPLCGLVIAYLGWPALFYLSAVQGLTFTLCWFLLVHDTPEQHPRISHDERQHIARGLVGGPVKTPPIPWRKMFSSLQVWATFVTGIGSDWGFYTLLTVGPKYMASILGVNIQQNGFLSALPFLCRYLFGICVAQVLDFCLRRQFLTLIQMRRCAVCISHLFPAVALIVFPLVGCDMAPAVALLCLAMAGNGAITSGHLQAYMDIAPNFAGTLEGFKNGLCSFTGIVSPLIIGAILERDASVSGWRIAFALSAAIYASSSLLFLCFFSARVQPWNEGTPHQIPVRVVLCALLLWSSLNAYVLRVTLSLSIVAMVGTKQTNISTSTQVNSSGCPKVDDGSTLLLNNNKLDEITEGEFDWSEATQGTILSAFFWGYMVLQAPGGRLAELVGGRRVMGIAMLIASLLSIATPPLARVHHSLLVAVRAVQGLVLTLPVPWKSALTSFQVWVPFIATLGSDWGFYTLLTLGPKYMSSIFGVNIQQNGVLSALPYLFRYVFGIFAGLGVDFALRHKLLSLLILRRCAVFITHVLPALMLMAFPFVGCDMLPAIALLCMSMACNGAITSGHFQGYMDIAPNFA
ncbi:hypothetical protein B566_EDAN006662, partial [Ephemera danica]